MCDRTGGEREEGKVGSIDLAHADPPTGGGNEEKNSSASERILIYKSGEYGVPKSWYFFVTPSYWRGSVGQGKGSGESALLLNPEQQQASEDDAVVLDKLSKVAPPFCLFFYNFCLVSHSFYCIIFIVLQSYKIGGCKGNSHFHAVKGVSLNMQRNQLFCMLGPNGAGKVFPLLPFCFLLILLISFSCLLF